VMVAVVVMVMVAVAVAVAVRVVDSMHQCSMAWHDLAVNLQSQKRDLEAEMTFRRSIAVREKDKDKDDHPTYMMTLHSLGELYVDTYTYTCIHMHTYMHTYMHACTCMHTHKHHTHTRVGLQSASVNPACNLTFASSTHSLCPTHSISMVLTFFSSRRPTNIFLLLVVVVLLLITLLHRYGSQGQFKMADTLLRKVTTLRAKKYGAQHGFVLPCSLCVSQRLYVSKNLSS
jgi:hypothetical protein